jgi:hypothetical protein
MITQWIINQTKAKSHLIIWSTILSIILINSKMQQQTIMIREEVQDSILAVHLRRTGQMSQWQLITMIAINKMIQLSILLKVITVIDVTPLINPLVSEMRSRSSIITSIVWDKKWASHPRLLVRSMSHPRTALMLAIMPAIIQVQLTI